MRPGKNRSSHRLTAANKDFHDCFTDIFVFRTSLFITCSFLYAFLLIIICLAFLTSEVVTDNSPLHYYEGFFTFLYLLSIFFLFYVFCYLLHESNCCRGDPEPAAYFQVSSDF
mgnify:CR=1 FL=1